MGTLYDLLGALPGDDADGLRAAFRRAAKATHPDIHPDDPDAARRFRELVRAYDILTDRDQRTTYDQLLTIALQPGASKPTSVYETVRKYASNTMAATIISGVLIGGYTLFGFFSNAPGAAEILPDGAMGQRAALTTSPEAAVERALGGPPANAGVEVEAIMAAAFSNGAAPQGRIANPFPGFALGNPLARRDPILAAGYLDREIILYRAPRFDRAFEPMVQAGRLSEPGRPKISPSARKPSEIRLPEARIPLPPRRAPMIAALTP